MKNHFIARLVEEFYRGLLKQPSHLPYTKNGHQGETSNSGYLCGPLLRRIYYLSNNRRHGGKSVLSGIAFGWACVRSWLSVPTWEPQKGTSLPSDLERWGDPGTPNTPSLRQAPAPPKHGGGGLQSRAVRGKTKRGIIGVISST